MARRRVCVAALILAAAAAELKGPHAGGVADRANNGESYCHRGRGGQAPRQAEARRKRIFNADGHFAKDISNHVGPPGRRAIHSPGPLLWHL